MSDVDVIEETFVCDNTFNGHRDSVSCVAFCSDGIYIVTGSLDKSLIVWNIVSGGCERNIEGHSAPVTSVAFSPDERLIASGSTDHSVKLWVAETGERKLTIRENSLVFGVAFSPDGKHVASAARDKCVRVWSVDDGACEQMFRGHTHRASSVAFSHNGQLIASASADGSIRLWKMPMGIYERTLKGTSGGVNCVAFAADGVHLVAGSTGIQLWNAHTGLCEVNFEESRTVVCVAISPDGQRVVSGSSGDNLVKVWNAATGKCEFSLDGHLGPVFGVAFSPDGTHIASGSGDKTLKVWKKVALTHKRRKLNRFITDDAADDEEVIVLPTEVAVGETVAVPATPDAAETTDAVREVGGTIEESSDDEDFFATALREEEIKAQQATREKMAFEAGRAAVLAEMAALKEVAASEEEDSEEEEVVPAKSEFVFPRAADFFANCKTFETEFARDVKAKGILILESFANQINTTRWVGCDVDVGYRVALGKYADTHTEFVKDLLEYVDAKLKEGGWTVNCHHVFRYEKGMIACIAYNITETK